MTEYLRCDQVSDDVIYDAFTQGYSDYIISVDMPKDQFVARFLEIDNDHTLSYIAMHGAKPVGFILGGIQQFKGIKTMRCGGFAIIPEFRGKGIAQELFKRHMQAARENDCKLLYLEVIKENTRALRFYEKAGYESVTDYRYYKLEDADSLHQAHVLHVQPADFALIKSIRDTMPMLHLCWQSEMFSLAQYDNVHHFCIEENGECVAALCINAKGLVHFLWVAPHRRAQGIGRALLAHAANELRLETLLAIAGNNLLYEGFLKRLGFTLQIEQHEMIKLL